MRQPWLPSMLRDLPPRAPGQLGLAPVPPVGVAEEAPPLPSSTGAVVGADRAARRRVAFRGRWVALVAGSVCADWSAGESAGSGCSGSADDAGPPASAAASAGVGSS